MNRIDTARHDEAFLTVLWAYVRQHRQATHSATRKKLREGLKDALKKWTDMPVKMASEAAAALAANCRQDIFRLMWTDRHRCGVEAGRSKILWEHTTPLNEAFETLAACADEAEVRRWMQGYSGVCWITRDEDDELNRRGYKSKRPGGWRDCYTRCGIMVLERPVSDSP